jgi:nucleoside-diphosphate-sugar epimerase
MVELKVLVTGATGFIGQHLCNHLLESDYLVRGALRAPTPPHRLDPRIEWVNVGEIGPDTCWNQALDGVSFVVHLAALAHQVGVSDRILEEKFRSVNTEGTRRLAESVARKGFIRRLVFISSFAAIGSGKTSKIPESAYGWSKRNAETELQEELRDCLTDWCVLRPPMVYGTGNPGNMARLIRLIDTGIPLPFGAIRNERNFLYVGNLVSAIECCLMHPEASRRAFSLSDGQPVSTPELVRELALCKGFPARLIPVPVSLMRSMGKLGDIVKSITGRSLGWDTYSVERLCGSCSVDTAEILERLNWVPPFSMRDGLRAIASRKEVRTNDEC